MLTRIAIDGFKTFADFSIDLEPFTVILGPNSSGKSNLFDAIRLLSQLAAQDLPTAMRGLRGKPLEMFRRYRSKKWKLGHWLMEMLCGQYLTQN